MFRFFLLTVSCFILSCVGNNKNDLYECYPGNEKRIEYFYTDFDANHDDVDLFSPTLRNKFEPLVLDIGQITIDSIAFNDLYSKLINLNKAEIKRDEVYYIFYQFKLFEKDSLKAIIVLNNENYFSCNGTDFIKDDTLAYRLKKALNIYNQFPVTERMKIFKEAKLFNLDTIPYKTYNDNNKLYYTGQLTGKAKQRIH